MRWRVASMTSCFAALVSARSGIPASDACAGVARSWPGSSAGRDPASRTRSSGPGPCSRLRGCRCGKGAAGPALAAGTLMIASRAMVARRRSLAATGALVCAALALWVSLGALTFLETDGRGAYAGVLPPLVWLGALLIAACTVAVVVRPSAAHVAPLWLSAVLLLPWLPVRFPMSVFIWAGALTRWLWAAIAALLLVPAIGRAI